MKVTFLNVGQGDSIVLENEIDGRNEIGIIDCNLTSDNRNRVVEFLKIKNVTSISFALLSHPHTDHFSGFLQFLEFIESQNITLNSFLITCNYTRQYINSCLKFNNDKLYLIKLFLKANELEKKGIIKKQYFITDAVEKNLLTEIKFIFLSPSTKEIQRFINKNYQGSEEENPTNIGDANLLSTCIKILVKNNSYILLTSDLEKMSFKRLRDDNFSENEELIVLGQIPHHGSSKNHDKIFWRQLKKKKLTPCIVSVGPNNYNHPDENVINDFIDLDYSINRTDQPIQKKLIDKSIKAASLILDNFSRKSNLDFSLGDKVFIF